VLAIAVITAFAPALRAPFLFDDVDAIPRNPTIENVFPLSVSLSPPPRTAVAGRPIVNLSLAIDRAINDALGIGVDTSDAPIAFHAMNIVLHLLCGMLLFGVIRRTAMLPSLGEWANGLAEPVAAVTVALWLLHPIQTEAVNYTIQRTELLVSLWYLATLYASIRAWDASSPRRAVAWLVAGVGACLAGMASKEVMAGAPFVVAAYDRAFRADSWRELFADRRRRWFYVALVATLGLVAALIAAGGRADSVGFSLGIPWYRYLYSQAWAIAHYLVLMVWPRDLRFDYGSHPVGGLLGVPGGVVLIAMLVATIVAWRSPRWRWCGFLGVWFFVLLAPSSSVVPIRTEIAAERRVYLASAAIIVAAVIGVARLLRTKLRALAWATAVVAAFLAVLTFRRSALYANPEALWRDAMVKVPANPRAYDNLAAVIYEKDRSRVSETDSLWSRALAIDSTYMPAWSNLAQVRLDAGRTAEARALLEHALRINPDYVDATRRLGAMLATQGDSSQSIAYLERIAASSAVTDQSLVLLGQAYINANRPDDAVGALRRALEMNPRAAEAASLLGAIYAEAGRFDVALPYFERAAANGDRNGMTYALLSLGYAQAGRGEESIRAARQAAQYAGADVNVWLTAGRAMVALGRPEEAQVYFDRAMQVAPNNPEAMTRLGLVKAALGDLPTAIQLFKRALAVSPGYPPAAQALAKATAR
jgi:tetratricopeptide (TPR) repeat protein